jgi:crossover junction endodeoxyribonuclease RuvC
MEKIGKVLGIDPGLSGGCAVLENGRLTYCTRMPVAKVGKQKLIAASELFDFLQVGPFDIAVIEWVHAMPKQGVSSMFTFGRATGAAEALAAVMSDRVEFVSPKSWKPHFNLSSSKRASLELARLKFGGDGNLWDKASNDGIAEAALIAAYWVDLNTDIFVW